MIGSLIGELMNERNARAALTALAKDPYMRLCDELTQIIFRYRREHGVDPEKIPLTSHEIKTLVKGWERMMNGTPHPYRQGAQLEYMGTPVYEWKSPFITSHRLTPPPRIQNQT